MYQSAGMPMKRMAMLPAAKIVPATPPPTAILDMLICGRAVSWLMMPF
jgi:hypothetical protein